MPWVVKGRTASEWMSPGAAAWVGATSCEVERVEPASARAAVRAKVVAALAE